MCIRDRHKRGAAHLKLERVAGISPAAPAGECSPAAPWVTPSDLAAHAVRRCCQRGLSPPYPPHTGRRGARRAEAREAAFAPAGRLYPSQHGVPRCSRVPGGRAITHAPTRGTREGVTRPREARWLMARQSFGPFEAERMTADDEGDDSSRLLSRQGPDLQDGGASSETRDHIFASRDENPDSWPPAAAGRRADTRELRDDDDILRLFLSPPPFQWCLPVGEASAAPPFRADVANGGSGHLFRQPRGGSRGGAAVAVAPSQLGGAWGAERRPAIPRDSGPHPSRMPRPRCAAQAPYGGSSWSAVFCTRVLRGAENSAGI